VTHSFVIRSDYRDASCHHTVIDCGAPFFLAGRFLVCFEIVCVCGCACACVSVLVSVSVSVYAYIYIYKESKS